MTHDNGVKLREAIAQAIYEHWDEAGRPEPEQAHVAADAVLPLVAEAEQRGYASGKADGMRTGYADAMRQHGLIERECPETYEDGLRDGEQRGYERGIAATFPDYADHCDQSFLEGQDQALAEARAKIRTLVSHSCEHDYGLIRRRDVLAVLDTLQAGGEA